MYPILFRLGPVTVQTYTFLIDAGLIAVLAWLYFAAPREKAGLWLDAGLAAAVGALLGARLFYVVANGSYYFGHPEEMVMIWTGGLSWAGAALGGLVGGGLYCTRRQEPLGPLLDAAAWPLVGLSLLSWGGCLAGGCAYGAQVTPGQAPAWLTMNAPDLYGIWSLRWATQLFGLAWGLLAAGVLALAAKAAWRSGARGLLTLGVLALGAALISLVRGDPDPGFSGNLRLDTAESALVLVAAAIGWAWLVRDSSGAPAAEPPAPETQAGRGEKPQGGGSGDDKV